MMGMLGNLLRHSNCQPKMAINCDFTPNSTELIKGKILEKTKQIKTRTSNIIHSRLVKDDPR